MPNNLDSNTAETISFFHMEWDQSPGDGGISLLFNMLYESLHNFAKTRVLLEHVYKLRSLTNS